MEATLFKPQYVKLAPSSFDVVAGCCYDSIQGWQLNQQHVAML